MAKLLQIVFTSLLYVRLGVWEMMLPQFLTRHLPIIQERDQIVEQQTALRQMEAILSVHKFIRGGRYGDALRELSKLSFLPLDSRTLDRSADAFQNLSLAVQACVPDLLRVALTCLDNVSDTDGTIHALKAKIIY